MVNKSKKDKLDELESLYKDRDITESEYKESRSNILSSQLLTLISILIDKFQEKYGIFPYKRKYFTTS